MNRRLPRTAATKRSWQWSVCAAAIVCVVGAGLAGVTATPAVATTTTTVVSTGSLAPHGPWKTEPTSNTGSFSFVSGPATPPSGIGSLRMTVADPPGQHDWLNNYAYGKCQTGPSCNAPQTSWQPLATIDALAFSVYRSSGGTYPSYNIEVDFDGSGSSYTTFVFEPNIGSVLNNTWQTWNALSPADGTWYSTHDTGLGTPFHCAFGSAGCNHSWSEIQTGYPLARIKYGLGPNVGTGGNFDGNIDKFTIGVSGNTTVYDFEPPPTVPGAPRSVYAVPGNAKAKLTWRPPASDGRSAITGYVVTPVKNGSAQAARVFNSTKTSQVITGLTNGAPYRFRVAARNAVGTGATASSGGIRVGAPGAPPMPTVSRPASGSLKVKFTAPSGNGAPITSFTATCSSSDGGASGSKSRSNNPITVTGLTAGKTYRCRVAATNSRGTGLRSAPSAPITA